MIKTAKGVFSSIQSSMSSKDSKISSLKIVPKRTDINMKKKYAQEIKVPVSSSIVFHENIYKSRMYTHLLSLKKQIINGINNQV